MIVDTVSGKVEGIDKGGVLQFRGIPFAWADRFCPPEPPRPWTGVRDASRFGPAAPQFPSPADSLLGLREQDTAEDCLALNVYTPAADDASRPVMVWIHGGGFTGGSGHIPSYNGTTLARTGDVVVVTTNYRLGALGYLFLDELMPDYAGSAVNGIRDQIAALRWVQENIASFGGDPHRVTLFGESAGGGSVTCLMAAPEARSLFHGAMVQSGTAEVLLAPDAAAVVAERVMDHLELTPSTIEELLDLPAEAILTAQQAVEESLMRTPLGPDQRGPAGPRFLQLPFQPIVDGDLIPRAPIEAVRDGSAAGKALVVGTTRDEWRLLMLNELARGAELSDDRLLRRATRLVGTEQAPAVVALYREAHPQACGNDLWCAMVTDKLFRMPSIRLAEAQLAHTADVAMYRFDYPSAAFGGLPGACHAIDVPFVFGTVDLPGIQVMLGGVDDDTRLLADRCVRAWLATAHSGRPAHHDLDWPAYDTDRRATCILDRKPQVVEDPDPEIRAFWT